MNTSTPLNRCALLVALCGLGYLAVLPISHTIALRNILLALLLIISIWTFARKKTCIRTCEFTEFPWIVLCWATYLFLFPLFSIDPQTAWGNLLHMWGKNLMAMIAGATVAWWLARHAIGSVLSLSIAASIPIFLYLSMFAWKAISTATIPWGYTGVEETHGVLSYAAGQAALLLTAALICSDGKRRNLIIALLIATILSMVLVRSRGGLTFSVLAVGLIFLASFRQASPGHRQLIVRSFFALAIIGIAAVLLASQTDSRWRGITNRMSAGLMGNAMQIHCEGPASIEKEIEEKFGKGEEAERIRNSVIDGDGIRVIMLRNGATLLLDHPWGLDGSRSAFQKRLLATCPTPVGNMSHSHNGWIDTALAIGIPGALIYFLVLISFMKIGLQRFGSELVSNPWQLILIATPIFWAIRAMVDSSLRDHMLEMQGFLLAYAAVALTRLRKYGPL